MIPKIIHYVWVGNNPKSDLINRCILSWQKYLPDYEIVEWGNDEVKNISNQYVAEAFENRKWAFVSDYMRLKALYEYGGLYFDTDLEITQNLERFLDFEFFSGFENYKGNVSPITALMGSEKGSPLIANLLNQYEHERFVRTDGSFNLKTNTQRISEFLRSEYSLSSNLDSSKTTYLAERIAIFPSYYFCTPEPKSVNYAVHHFDGSWHVGLERKCIMKFGRFKILLLRKIKDQNSRSLPIYGNEVLQWCSPVAKGMCLAAVKKK